MDISGHCIQTALKRAYENTLRDCLMKKGDVSESMEMLMETLARIMESTDFQLLRSRFPVLSGYSDALVKLCIYAEGVFLNVNGETIIDMREYGDFRKFRSS